MFLQAFKDKQPSKVFLNLVTLSLSSDRWESRIIEQIGKTAKYINKKKAPNLYYLYIF